MALIKVPIIPPQAQPILEDRGNSPLMSRVFWTFLSTAQSALQMIAGAVDVIERTFVRGSTALLNVGAIPKVSPAGSLAESALTDDLASIVVAGRHIILTNAKIIKQYAADGVTLRNLLTHFSDDIVYLDNPDGGIELRPVTEGVSVNKAPTANGVDSLDDINTDGVYKVGNVQVVSARGAGITASAGAGNAAGIAYLQADAATWVTLMNNLRTRVSELEARLQAHGLIS